MLTVGTIGGIILLVILGIAVCVGLKKSKDSKAVEKFLTGLGDKILEITLETINDMNPDGFTDFFTFRDLVINNIYVAIWDYVATQAEEAVEVDNITKTVFKMIDKDTVIKFIDAIIEKNNVEETIKNVYGASKIQALIDEGPEEEEYTDQTQYVEDSENFELPAYTEKEHSPEELASINPPSDEESDVVDLEDDTIEILVDEKEIVTQVSKNGTTLYYELDKDGKKTRVSKEYALQFLNKEESSDE